MDQQRIAQHRIVVGVDGSPAAQAALNWAVREAVAVHSRLLVVTAWQLPIAGRRWPTSELRQEWRRRIDVQLTAIRTALAGVPVEQRPVVGRQLIMADPVTALRHAARLADLVVIGGTSRGRHTGVASGLAGTTQADLTLVVVTPVGPVVLPTALTPVGAGLVARVPVSVAAATASVAPEPRVPAAAESIDQRVPVPA